MTQKQPKKKRLDIRPGRREQVLEIMKTVRDYDFTKDEMDLLIHCLAELRDVGLAGIIAQYAPKS